MVKARCHDCLLPYEFHGADVVVENDDWDQICAPEDKGIILCGLCIARRVAEIPEAIILKARIVSAN